MLNLRCVNEQKLLHQLTDIVAPSCITEGIEDNCPTWAMAPPLAFVMPERIEDVPGIVLAAESESAAIIVVGGGTEIASGGSPPTDRPYVVLSTARLNRITDFQPDDLTVTAEPGVTLSALQQLVSSRRLFLPLDVPLSDRATMGGIVSAGTCGFWRPAYGAPRDLLIGLKAVMTGGIVVKGGGRVVKNVAGYDVCKLFTGAHGTLGALTELTFKLRPLPEADRTVSWDAPSISAAARLGFELHQARLAPTFIVATNEPMGTPRLLIGLQGLAPRVEWQVREFAQRLSIAGWNSLPNVIPPPELTALRDCLNPSDAENMLSIRMSVLPTEAVSLAAQFEGIPDGRLMIHCSTGITKLSFNCANDEMFKTVKSLIPADANVVWTRLGADRAKAGIARFGDTRKEFALHRSLKLALDPKSTFNPGRFFGGL